MLPLEHSAILSTFIKLQIVIKVFVLTIFECPFYTGFTVFSSFRHWLAKSFLRDICKLSAQDHLGISDDFVTIITY